MPTQAPTPKYTAYDTNGDPLSGGLLYTYLTGTTTKEATYTDSAGGTANANPVVLDSAGRADVWLTTGTAYTFTLAPSGDTDPPTAAIWTVNNIEGVSNASSGSFIEKDGTTQMTGAWNQGDQNITNIGDLAHQDDLWNITNDVAGIKIDITSAGNLTLDTNSGQLLFVQNEGIGFTFDDDNFLWEQTSGNTELQLTNKTAGSDMYLSLNSNAGDSTDDVGLMIYGFGEEGDSNTQDLRIFYDYANTEYVILAEKAGSQTAKDIRLRPSGEATGILFTEDTITLSGSIPTIDHVSNGSSIILNTAVTMTAGSAFNITSTGANNVLITSGATGGITLTETSGCTFNVGTNTVSINPVRSGATQGGASASANEVWKTASHATLPDNVLMIGV